MAIFNTYDELDAPEFVTYEGVQSPQAEQTYETSTISKPLTLPQRNISVSIPSKTSNDDKSSTGSWLDKFENSVSFNFPGAQLLILSNKYTPQEGDTAQIETPNHISKYGHAATYHIDPKTGKGGWYSDFKLKKLNVYNNPNVKITIFRNPNLEEAKKQGAKVAAGAGASSQKQCAAFVRVGLGYQPMSVNGRDFGKLLLHHNWVKVTDSDSDKSILSAAQGASLPYFTYTGNKFTPTTFRRNIEDPIQSPEINLEKDTEDSETETSQTSTSWLDNLEMSSNTPIQLETSLSTMSQPAPTLVGGINMKKVWGATDADYNSKLNDVMKSIDKAKGKNKVFADNMLAAYRKAGVDPNTAKMFTALDILETGWGKSLSGKNNYGGIKGKGTVKTTHELDAKGNSYETKAEFKDFNSLDDYVQAKLKLVNKRLS